MRSKSTEISGESTPRRHLRVCTFGLFQIEWVDPATSQVTPLPPERLRGQNAGSALGLFKSLLSCPDRFATRSWLNEQFWPNSRQKSAEERLNDVVTSLRTLLRPKGSTEMFVHFVYGTSGRGAGFRLDSYPNLWCDADAFEWYVKHALLLDQRGQDSTACWEHAYTLASRGTYLSEQIEEDWSSPRRGYLNGLVRDCVHRWTQLLWQLGHANEAIMRLRSYWLEHPTDEDALCPLLDMLGECGRFAEAEECYTKAQAALAEENHALDERTIHAIEIVRALKIRRLPVARFSPSSLQTPFSDQSDYFQGIMFSQPFSGDQSLKQSRRQILSGMISSAYTMWTLSPYLFLAPEKQESVFAAFQGASLNKTVLDSLEHITRNYWKLSANLSTPLLSSLQGHFQCIVQLLGTPHSFLIQQQLFSLAGEAAQLLGKTLCDLRDYPLALSYYSFAVKAALESKHGDLWAAALGRIALLLLSTEQPQQALGCLKEVQNTPPPSLKIRSWCSAIEAEAHAYLEKNRQCVYALERAKAVPKDLFFEADPYATGFTAPRLASYEGSCYLRLHQPEKALPILQQALSESDPISLRSRSRLFVYESTAYTLLGNTQQACMSLSQALDLTFQTQSLDVLYHIHLLSSKLMREGNMTMLKDLNVRIQEAQIAIMHSGDLYE